MGNCFSRHSRTSEDLVVRRARLSLSSLATSRSGNFKEIVVVSIRVLLGHGSGNTVLVRRREKTCGQDEQELQDVDFGPLRWRPCRCPAPLFFGFIQEWPHATAAMVAKKGARGQFSDELPASTPGKLFSKPVCSVPLRPWRFPMIQKVGMLLINNLGNEVSRAVSRFRMNQGALRELFCLRWIVTA